MSECKRDIQDPSKLRLCLDPEFLARTAEDAANLDAWIATLKRAGITLGLSVKDLFVGVFGASLPHLASAALRLVKKGLGNIEYVGHPDLCGECMGNPDCPTLDRVNDALRAQGAQP